MSFEPGDPSCNWRDIRNGLGGPSAFGSRRVNEIIAARIIEFANNGARNPDLLCEGVLMEFRDQQL
jgi:hypothetical protein